MDIVYQFIQKISHDRKKLYSIVIVLIIAELLLFFKINILYQIIVKFGLGDAAHSAMFSILFVLALIGFIDYRNRTHSVSRVSLSKDEMLTMYQEEKKFIRMGGITLRSVEYHFYYDAPELSLLSIHIEKRFFQVPWYIKMYCKDLISPFDPSLIYNGKTYRFEGLGRSDKEFIFSYATYFDYLVTNGSHNQKLFSGLTVRSLLEPGPALAPLQAATCANHLGINVLLLSSDNHLLLQVRSKNTAVFSRCLSPSVSGAANLDTFEGRGSPSFISWFETEVHEELSDDLDIDDFESIKVLGLSREIIRLGKPELFLLAKCCKSKQELSIIFDKKELEKKRSIDFHRKGGLAFPAHINRTETERFVWIGLPSQDSFIKDIREHKDENICLNVNGALYVVSESLAVNMAFLFKHLHETKQL